MKPNQRSGSILAGTLAPLDAATLAVLFLTQDLPQPLWVCVAFAAAFVGLEFSSVEVSDRLYVSGSRWQLSPRPWCSGGAVRCWRWR